MCTLLCVCVGRELGFNTTNIHNSMQRDPVVSKASELLRLGLMPSPAEIRNGKVCARCLTYPEMTLSSIPLQDLLSIDIQTVNVKAKVTQ